jgi:glycosyltransferase involved in cell wall biosynthesis
MNACTIIAGNYVAHARVLAESFLTHHPGGTFTVLVVDDEARQMPQDVELDGRVEWWRLSDLPLDVAEIHRLAGIYEVTELATAVKPLFLQCLLRAHASVVIYLDPDIRIYGSMAWGGRLADIHGVVLTPHITEPFPDDGRGVDSLFVLAAGIYNLGFIAVAPSARPCLEWWWRQTRRRALIDVARQMFTDQRWADYMPSLFSHHLLKDPGYNVAYWNLHERRVTSELGRFYARNVPLRFFHFSGFDPQKPWVLSRHQGDRPRILLSESPELTALCDDYALALEHAGVRLASQRPYGWSHTADGIELTSRIRRLYWSAVMAAEQGQAPEPPDPFDSACPQAFTAWLNSPAEDGPQGWSRYLYALYQARPDVQAHFRDITGVDRPRLACWLRTDGVVQEHIPSSLLPPDPGPGAIGPQSGEVHESLPPGVNVTGYFRSELGVGEAARLLLQAFEAADIAYATATQVAPQSRQQHSFDPHEAARALSFDVNVLCVNADATPGFARDAGSAFFAGRYTIGYWFWEVDPLPREMHAAFDHVDEVWTATDYVADIVRAASGGRKPVHTVPLALTTPAVTPSITREQLELPAGRFVFLFVFDFLSVMERKNPRGLIDAFCTAFAPGEGPVLLLKSINGHARVPDLERLRHAAAHRSDIFIRDGYVTAAEKNAMLAACDCYVSLHRAEGLGLTMAEAMALGTPVIATGYSGNRHFMSDENSWLVDYTVVPVCGECAPYPPEAVWAEPDLAHAARLMRMVYDDPRAAAARADRARADLAAHHGVDAAAAAVSARLSHIRLDRAAAEAPAETALVDLPVPVPQGDPAEDTQGVDQIPAEELVLPDPVPEERLEPPSPIVDEMAATQPVYAPEVPTVIGYPKWRDLRVALLILVCCLFVYNLNGRAISAGDALPARYLPFAILGHQTVLLDPVEALTSQGRERPLSWQSPQPGSAFWMVPTPDGRLASLYSVVLPVLVTPLYVPAVAYVHVRGWTDERVDRVARLMEKVTASLVTALSAALLYLVLRRRQAPERIAILLTIAYAFGTTTWVISSQALWQHGMAQLLVVSLLLMLTARPTLLRTVLAGLICGLVAANRPADFVLVGPVGVFGLYWAGRRRALLFAAAAAAPLGLVVVYNLLVVGAAGGGYGRVASLEAYGLDAFFGFDIVAGLAGLLFSPTRGLFVFSPFLLFLVLAWKYRSQDRGRALTLAMAAGVVLQILAYAKTDWRGGISWGPRFMTDLLPMMIVLLVPVLTGLRRTGRVAFAACVAVAIVIEAIGAFMYTGATDVPIFAVSQGPERLKAAWDWRNTPFIASLSHGRAPAELTALKRGRIEAFEVDGRAVESVVAGMQVVVKGWALAGYETPLQVGITIDGTDTIATRTFVDRPDVQAALPGSGPSGWSIPIDTTAMAVGEHRLSMYIWSAENGEAHFFTRRTLTVQAGGGHDLDASARIASARIRAHQQPAGYWLTAFTTTTRFEDPRDEMNTYLTSMLVDLLEPLAIDGLRDTKARARQHLTDQIESSGLVRYHGQPGAPGIGTLGCAITPDTDDTALVWRIAPGRDRGRLSAALDVIDSYRRPDGLYRTWLAPRAEYQCLDPGTDPNPADNTIQMHLLQLLMTERPAEGRALCAALQRNIDLDQGWVYYELTPIVPMLRLTDLDRVGCRLHRPEARLRPPLPGQDIWVSVVRLLARASLPGSEPPAVAEVTDVLRELARDDFAYVRVNPPLLYHNDLTATVPRYYWSADVGYALWLRLAAERTRIAAPAVTR